MPVASMTGFARFEGETGDVGYIWELRSVNGKGLEIRLRLPQGFEMLEPEIRRMAGTRLSRGNVQVSLQIRRSDDAPVFVVNQHMLAQVLRLCRDLVEQGSAALPTADGLLAIKGIVEPAENGASSKLVEETQRDILQGFAIAVGRLVLAREEEGAALKAVLSARLEEIAILTERAEEDPARTPEAIRRRLSAQVQELLHGSERLDVQRLHQEAALLAAKADIREEIDRLRAHLGAARALLEEGGPIGRRLDFLSQEFNRESNTICSKSTATSLTAIGLELKVVVDQFKEQVQNIE